MSRITRVQEDALETVFLGEDKVSKPVKISTLLEADFMNIAGGIAGRI